ncbi:hypothetical protein COV19_03405 [Candidatus Woesearchaeota archaeon CG10_big_fil_rev_8_21_14_0_10_44_13]|nr:MAG: hypothetical protein COV19_03405 [Candidatus Woesearchaeota archaeon CG10_big_fil_rev_8_21_14_0_10_44_13]
MGVTIIATLFSYEPVIAGVTKFGADRLVLLVDKPPLKEQEEAIKKVKEALGIYVQIDIHKTEVYDIVEVARDVVSIIDKIDKDETIHLNISAARKTKSLGLMFAGYARSSRIDKIVYLTKEEKKAIILPKLSFNLSNTQMKVLEYLEKMEFDVKKMTVSTKISRATIFKTAKELKDTGFIDDDYKLTDAGKIARL